MDKDLLNKLFELARAVIDELYEFKSENADTYNERLLGLVDYCQKNIS